MTPLERLNDLPRPEAEAEFGSCCGSPEWARRMAEGRPFGDARELLETADLLWWSLGEAEWREAFRSHPRIGERSAEAPQSTRAAAWSTAEQAGVGNSPEATLHALAEGNRAYEARFGYIYIVCASGRSAKEMLALLRERLGHAPDAEVLIASEEQRRITRLRLEKLLGEDRHPEP